MTRKATIVDYINRQGGKPEVSLGTDGLWHIVHAYLDSQVEIVTHISPEQRGTIILDDVEYLVSCLWQFEGKPCESISSAVGGDGYQRRRVEG